MQDGASISGDDASAWLRQHFAGDQAPEISLTWNEATTPDEGAYARLLHILFAPTPDDRAA